MGDAKLISASLKLPATKREKVAEAHLTSTKSPGRGHLNKLWAQESESRIDALLVDRIKTVSGGKVLRYRALK